MYFHEILVKSVHETIHLLIESNKKGGTLTSKASQVLRYIDESSPIDSMIKYSLFAH